MDGGVLRRQFGLVLRDCRGHAGLRERNRRLYRRLVDGPVPRRDACWFVKHTNRLIRDGELMA